MLLINIAHPSEIDKIRTMLNYAPTIRGYGIIGAFFQRICVSFDIQRRQVDMERIRDVLLGLYAYSGIIYLRFSYEIRFSLLLIGRSLCFVCMFLSYWLCFLQFPFPGCSSFLVWLLCILCFCGLSFLFSTELRSRNFTSLDAQMVLARRRIQFAWL